MSILMSVIKKILPLTFLFGGSISYTHADLVELNSTTTDRIEMLTSTLANGAYADSDDSSKTTQFNTEISESPQVVLQEDYKHLNIKPLYKNSVVKYFPKSREYYEIKKFPNNIHMYKSTDENFALFLDLDMDNPYKSAWSVNCQIDQITDEKICAVLKYEFMLMRSSKTGWSLTVSKEIERLNTYRYHYLRVDKNTPFKTKLIFNGTSVNPIINQMKNGQTLYTRFYEWSDFYEETISLYGFSAAYETMNLIYSQLK